MCTHDRILTKNNDPKNDNQSNLQSNIDENFVFITIPLDMDNDNDINNNNIDNVKKEEQNIRPPKRFGEINLDLQRYSSNRLDKMDDGTKFIHSIATIILFILILAIFQLLIYLYSSLFL
ncbi:hypothetical protein DERP_001771 [Dermatophagoides pteronyssinus]|uniref:Uncharacterized protein n=1 Tax=Dermatophagoides pteronyssinus TaxID=6956 RepID=A0ABQ8JBL4_DERPT|nr:hypothetical protein DERP_001771 [Dermatophagoides pteronyssinus]